MPRAKAISAAADTMRMLPTVGLRATSNPRISSGVTPDLEGEGHLENVGCRRSIGGDQGGDVDQRVGLRIEPGCLQIVEASLEKPFQRVRVVLGDTDKDVAGSRGDSHVQSSFVDL